MFTAGTYQHLARDRFIALDSLRGIAALIVALLHLDQRGFISGSDFVLAGRYMVDFFFVLSGFVISAAYGAKMVNGYPFAHFFALRLGRLYPLYLVLLVVYIIYSAALTTLHGHPLSWHGILLDNGSPLDLLLTFLMLQALRNPDGLEWTFVSWSISVELMAYIVASAFWKGFGNRAFMLLPLGSLVILAVFSLAPHALSGAMTTYLLRGLGGFGIGVGYWRLFVGTLEARRGDPPRFIASVCEVTWFVAVFIIVAHREFAGKLFIADLVFGLGIIIFAAQLGAVSNMLRLRPFYWLGVLSYSIYLIHSPLETVVALVLYKLGLAFRVPIESRTQIDLGAVGSELMGLATLVLVVAVAWITWRVIEEPCRRWSRRKISHFDARKAALAGPPVTQLAQRSPALG